MTQEDILKITYPYIEIQSDFQDCINDVLACDENTEEQQETFYINVQEDVESVSFEEKIKVSKRGDQESYQSIKGGDSAEFQKIDDNNYVYSIPRNKINTNFQTPSLKSFSVSTLDTQEYDIINGNLENFTSIDVSSNNDGEIAIIGDFEGFVKILHKAQNSNGGIEYQLVRNLSAHLGLVTKVCMFPSNKVMLTGSIDKTIKIFSLEGEYNNPRTFVGHTESVRDLKLIDNGRNFLSCSDDGTIKLWECGSGLCMHTFRRDGGYYDSILSMEMVSMTSFGIDVDSFYDSADSDSAVSSMEFNTKGWLVFASHKSGHISCFDIYTKKQLFELASPFSEQHVECTSLAFDESGKKLYCSYANGTVYEWEVLLKSNNQETNTNENGNDFATPLIHPVCRATRVFEFQRGQEIKKISLVNNSHLYIASEFGANICLNLDEKFPETKYLVCDSKDIGDFNFKSGKMYVVGSDGLFAMYS